MSMKTQIEENDGKYNLYIDGNKVSTATAYTFDDVDNFDWILLADITTFKKYQRKGYALALLTKMLEDLKKRYPKKGYYLLVKSDNIPAIKLYQKLGFRSIRELYDTETKERTQYTVMVKGQSNINQLMKAQFHGFLDKK